jgi:outer membrane protein OmpA-like peptidoglycan-associated protein
MNNDSEWMSISDMMSGLMLIFMFIAISFMIQVEEDKNKTEKINKKLQRLIKEAKKDQTKIENIARTYYKDKEELNKALTEEFNKNLKDWEAEITKDNIIVFNSPTVLFNTGESSLKKNFKSILNDFFPRYIKILSSKKYLNEIDEIRIEGHTSNTWNKGLKEDITYLKNMKLSQDRANNVLAYCYSLKNEFIHKNSKWLQKHFRANGMAFSKLKYLDNNHSVVDLIKSKRVEFRVQMKTEEKIHKILEVSK